MKRVALGAVVALWLVAGAATGAERAKITNPDWLERPSGEDFAEHYPNVASRFEIEGRASISCSVDAEGRLVGCVVTAEDPVGLGFGEAALAMSGDFKMRPMAKDGVPVDGGTVRIPLRFVLPEGPKAVAPPEASPAAMTQALRAIDAFGFLDRADSEYAKALDTEKPQPGISTALREEAKTVALAAWARNRAARRDAYARAFASVFTEEEMSGLADFVRGPGKALLEHPPEMLKAMGEAGRQMALKLRPEALKAFCATAACPTPAQLANVWRAQESRDGRIDNPQWLRDTAEYALIRAAPGPAAIVGLNGAVRMTCRVKKDGALDDCKADEELPQGLGYGAAALKLADAYRLSPIQLAAGAEGRRVTVRVGFPATTLPDPATPPKVSDTALAAGRKLVDANESLATARRDIEVQILGFESRKPEAVDAKTYDALLEAYRTGAFAAAEAGLDMQARVWAAHRTEAELATLATFQASPAGKAFRERNGAADVALRNAAAFVARQITADGRAVFCKSRVCDAPPVQPTATSSEPSTRKP